MIALAPSSVAFWIAQSIRSPRDRPWQVDMQWGLGLAGQGLVRVTHGFLADVEQLATKLLATAVEQLHSVSGRHAQHAANVVGLGFGQLVLAEAQGRR